MEPDFTGVATKANLVCTDGRIIMPDAFAHQDKTKVPLVWSHQHSSIDNVLGHVWLYKHEGDMRCEAFLDKDTPQGKSAASLVKHGSIESLSIWANQLLEKLTKDGKQVLHGAIKEVSLVLAGANEGAKIDNLKLVHGDGADPEDFELVEDEAIIHTGILIEVDGKPVTPVEKTEEKLEHGEEEVQDYEKVYESLNEEQKDFFLAMAGTLLDDKLTPEQIAEHSAATKKAEADALAAAEKKGGDGADLTHQEGNIKTMNAFERFGNQGGAPSHGPITATLSHGLSEEKLTTLAHSVFEDFHDESNQLSFKQTVLKHAGEYGITNIEVLFPDAQTIDQRPEWITRKMEWVEDIINGTRKLPYSRIKSQSADLTHEEARAKGYIKGEIKKNQYFEIAGRETTPKTVYKKQQLDRDDIIDITDFDVVAWLWVEMRFMLREEIARAILCGDGREVDDPDKISETNIRPIAMDDEFYTDVILVPANVNGSALVESVVRGRETLLAEGEPVAYMTRSVLNDMLLVKDTLQRRLYRNRAELAAELEVSKIVLVPVMAGLMRDENEVLMILVNMSDYAVGSTKGGEVTTFEDFDIKVNQYEYLIETRLSGALTRHKRAQVVLRDAGTLATPTVPTFVPATGVVTIPTVTGVTYKNADTDATLSAGAQSAIAAGATVTVKAVPNTGYFFPHNFDNDWAFTRPLV